MKKTDTWLNPLPQKNISRVVADQIIDAIANGKLQPGDFLPSETQLSKTLNVGKSSVREATKMLEAVGVIEILKGHGSKIRTEISPDALNPLTFALILQSNSNHEKLVEFRSVIESVAYGIAVEAIKEEEIERLKQIQQQMEANMLEKVNNLELDIEFHKLVYIGTQNPFFACVGSAIMTLLKSTISISHEKTPELVNQHHANILEALVKRDKNLMLNAVNEYIHTWDVISLHKESSE